MRSIRVLAATALFAISAVPLLAACPLPLTVTTFPGTNTAQTFRLSWPAVTGATQYEIQSSSDGFVNTKSLRVFDAGTSSVTISQKTSEPFIIYSYRVIASNPSNPFDVQCIGTTTTRFSAFALAPLVRKTVIPVAGSTRGLNNADFKTSLRIGPATSSHGGKIVFHPAGQPGSENDPSITYRLENGGFVQYDDIVAAIGQSGIGSIDIISTFPPVSAYPGLEMLPVEVRVFNQTPTGTFGGFESAVQGADAFRPADWSVLVPSARFRVNVGVRTITTAHVTFFHFSATRQLTTKVLDLPGDYVFMQAADSFFGEPVQEGDVIVMHFDGSDTIAVPFHTFTDNSTNDPSIFNIASPYRTYVPDIDVVTISN
jgi:hypothetical protein